MIQIRLLTSGATYLLVATYEISKNSSYFKNSKTQNLFQAILSNFCFEPPLPKWDKTNFLNFKTNIYM